MPSPPMLLSDVMATSRRSMSTISDQWLRRRPVSSFGVRQESESLAELGMKPPSTPTPNRPLPYGGVDTLDMSTLLSMNLEDQLESPICYDGLIDTPLLWRSKVHL